MYDLQIHPPTAQGKPEILCIANCDKEGSIVAARLASASDRIASGRPLSISVDRFTDRNFPRDMATRLAGYYEDLPPSPLLNDETVVLSSCHRAGLYIAEVLHACLLPAQILSFARSVEEAAQSPWLSIAGSDYDCGHLWQWNKITAPEEFPEAYVERLRKAKRFVVVRSIDDDSDCPVIARYGNVFFNATLPRLQPRQWRSLSSEIEQHEGPWPSLGQWEWGLPDAALDAALALWQDLGKSSCDFHVIEGTTIDLFHGIPKVWETYLQLNRANIGGVSLNAYWIAHPGYERRTGLIPMPFYRFSTIANLAYQTLSQYSQQPDMRFLAFVNEIGGKSDPMETADLIRDLSMSERFWFSNGCDCPDAVCKDIFNLPIPRPFEKIGEWWRDAVNTDIQFSPVEIKKVKGVFGSR